MNWLNYLFTDKQSDLAARIFTFAPGNKFERYNNSSEYIKIYRISEVRGGSIHRLFQYLRFYLLTLIHLVIWRPSVVFYYETLSALPVLLYKWIFNRNASVFVHYHEYASPSEYKYGMVLSRWIHKCEQRSYHLFEWISHTNADRIKLFKEDNKKFSLPYIHTVPNYPPDSWKSDRAGTVNSDAIIKLVYVGALNMETMYVRELVDWVNNMEGTVTLDFYSTNYSHETIAYISSLLSPHISFHGGIEYYLLPDILKQYHVGVILYKGHIPNYVYNAPNKLFEYYACGLDVWFPDEMIGSKPYITNGTYPRISAVNFMKLQDMDVYALTSRLNLVYKDSDYYCNSVFYELYNSLKKNADN